MTEENKTKATKATKSEKPKKEKKPRKRNYINNKDLLAELAKSNAQDKLTDELVKMLMTLTQRYAKVPRFANYTYNEDMQAYALLIISKNWRRFDCEKGKNPFAYFTQTIKTAFYQFDNLERHQRDIRDKLLVNNGENPSFSYLDRYGNDDFSDQMSDNSSSVIQYNYEGEMDEE